ncbi:MAG: SAM-dependent DNA methyltransferase [Betaproteobacteria bacterium]|nr:SAM-dependent DNA methyltransferase [Betaproteobacteria bacterium]
MSQIKSKDRVRDLAEVYTNEREVNAMLNLIPINKPDDIITYKYLEPACGNGNFLIEILRRKLMRVNEKYDKAALNIYEFYVARTLTTIYGIDICQDNVDEARHRLFTEIKSNFDTHRGSFIYSKGYLPLIWYILEKNIVVGDAINAPEKIELTDFKVKGKQFEQRVYYFSTLVDSNPKPIKAIKLKHFLEIGKKNERKQRHLSFV